MAVFERVKAEHDKRRGGGRGVLCRPVFDALWHSAWFTDKAITPQSTIERDQMFYFLFLVFTLRATPAITAVQIL